MAVETLTMGEPVVASFKVCPTTRAVLTAVADEAVADTAHDSHPQSLRVEAEADGLDLDVMEHRRQSRLRRWQEQRDRR